MSEHKIASLVPAVAVQQDSYVQLVPDHCDRIVWRNNYYHLPILTKAERDAIAAAEAAKRR